MSENVRRFPGRLDLAIAAYNSGAWYQYPPKSGKQVYFDALKNKTSFKDLKDKLPKETYEYVSTIMQP
jgi:hypothetical protein